MPASLMDFLVTPEDRLRESNSQPGLPPVQAPFTDYGPWGAGGPQTVFAPPDIAQTPDYNPLMDPKQSGVLGFLAKVSGAPTQEMALAQKQGAMSSGMLQALQQRIGAGMSPQKAVVDLMNSQEGQQWFTTPGANPMQDITQYLAATQTKPQDLMNVPEGGTVFDPNKGTVAYKAPEKLISIEGNLYDPNKGQVVYSAPDKGQVLAAGTKLVGAGGNELASNPTTELQNATGFLDMAKATPEEREKFAEVMSQGMETKDMTQTERATKWLLDNGMIDAEAKHKFDAGLLSWQPVLDPAGRTIGHVARDLAGAVVGQPVMLDGAEGTTPDALQNGDSEIGVGRSKGTTLKDLAPGAALLNLKDPTDIVYGSNSINDLATFAGGLIGNVLPEFSAKQSMDQKNAISDIKQALIALPNDSQMTKVERELALQPLENARNPIQVASALIGLMDTLENRRAEAIRQLNEGKTAEVRGKMASEVSDLEAIMARIPSKASMQDRLTRLEGGEDSTYEKYKQFWMGGDGQEGKLPDLTGGLGGLVSDTIGTAEKAGATVMDAGKTAVAKGKQAFDKAAATPAGPKPGSVVDNFVFIGGNPNEQKNWRAKGAK